MEVQPECSFDRDVGFQRGIPFSISENKASIKQAHCEWAGQEHTGQTVLQQGTPGIQHCTHLWCYCALQFCRWPKLVDGKQYHNWAAENWTYFSGVGGGGQEGLFIKVASPVKSLIGSPCLWWDRGSRICADFVQELGLVKWRASWSWSMHLLISSVAATVEFNCSIFITRESYLASSSARHGWMPSTIRAVAAMGFIPCRILQKDSPSSSRLGL